MAATVRIGTCSWADEALSKYFYPPKLPARLVAISHVLAVGSPYAVPNVLPVKIPTSQGAPEVPAKPTAVNSPSAARK